MPNGYIIRMREDDMMKKYDVIVIGTGSGNIILEEALKRGFHARKSNGISSAALA